MHGHATPDELELEAAMSALNKANVPAFDRAIEGVATGQTRALSLEERIVLLVRECDEARRLAAETAHALANEKQLHEAIAERVVFAMWIYPAYRVDSRGPSGCLMDVLDRVAPPIAAAFRDNVDGHDVYARFFGESLPEGDIPREGECPPRDEGWMTGVREAIQTLAKQPRPTPNDNPAIVDLVVEDLAQRDALGVRTYGTRLQAHNGRDSLRDAYEEALDMALYLRQCIEERSCPDSTDRRILHAIREDIAECGIADRTRAFRSRDEEDEHNAALAKSAIALLDKLIQGGAK